MFTMRREDLTYVDRAPVVVEESVVVDATPDRLWPALADASAWAEWFADVRAVRYTSPAPYGVGSTRYVHVAGFKVDEEILAFDECERFAFVVTRGNLPLLHALVEVITLTPEGERTRVTYRRRWSCAPGSSRWSSLSARRCSRACGRGLLASVLGSWSARSGLRPQRSSK